MDGVYGGGFWGGFNACVRRRGGRSSSQDTVSGVSRFFVIRRTLLPSNLSIGGFQALPSFLKNCKNADVASMSI